MLEDFEACRLCAEYNKTMSPISLFAKNRKLLLQKIFQLTGLKLKRLTNLPSVVCLDCEKDLNSAFEFRSRCLTAQTYFSSSEYKRRGEHQQEKQSEDKCKTGSDLTKGEQLTFATENERVATELEIKVEQSCCSDTERSTCNQSEFIALDEVEYNDNDMKDDIEFPLENLSYDCKTPKLDRIDSKKCMPATEVDTTVEAVEDLLKTDIDVELPKKTNRVKSKSKEKKKEKPTHLICDQCGNHFTNRCHFYTHIKRHTGVKTVQCEVCPDKFFTNGELKRHMRRHTGERPFACKHCQRRFTDNSTRIKHERTHTNERPFECPHCDKAFTTGYILKNHMLVHTGERSFICVPCNKSFQRQTILDVHTRSLAHKQNIERGHLR